MDGMSRESQPWNEKTHLLQCAEREQDCKADDTLNRAQNHTKSSRLPTNRVRESVS